MGNSLSIPDLMRHAYGQGLFPMADSRDSAAAVDWYLPPERAVFVPSRFHVSRRLARLLRQQPFELRWNDDLRAVMQACGDVRGDTWINPPLIDAFVQWQQQRGEVFCLSVFQDNRRVGGIYGVQLGALFTAESMFSLVPNASSVALVALIAGLAKAGIQVLDAQIANAHTARFNLLLWHDAHYQKVLQDLQHQPVTLNKDYFCFDVVNSFVQSLTHTS